MELTLPASVPLVQTFSPKADFSKILGAARNLLKKEKNEGDTGFLIQHPFIPAMFGPESNACIYTSNHFESDNRYLLIKRIEGIDIWRKMLSELKASVDFPDDFEKPTEKVFTVIDSFLLDHRSRIPLEVRFDYLEEGGINLIFNLRGSRVKLYFYNDGEFSMLVKKDGQNAKVWGYKSLDEFVEGFITKVDDFGSFKLLRV